MADHNELGKLGEEHAVELLLNSGMQLLERNWRNNKAEVDIIAKDGNFLVLVEVKTRNTDFFGAPDSFVDKGKQNRLADAAEAYLNSKRWEMEVRYDIVSVVFEKSIKLSIRHIKDAFFPDDLNLSGFDF